MEICFVLIEPRQAENVGAAARALKTMGHSRLRLVNSYLQHHHRARIVAHGARDILASATSHPDLAACLADADLVIGTTAKQRHLRRSVFEPGELATLLANKDKTVRRCAILFGREDNGLSNRELAYCDTLSTIPLHTDFPSLNLGQAVMLYASALAPVVTTPVGDAPGSDEFLALKNRLGELLEDLGVEPNSPPYRWAMEKLPALSGEDIRFAHMLTRQLEKQLGQGGNKGEG